MQNKEHLRIEGLRHILALKASLNLGLSVELKEAFPGIIPIGRSFRPPSLSSLSFSSRERERKRGKREGGKG